jgi:hypothetical protein
MSMKYEILNMKSQTNSKLEVRNGSGVSVSDFGILISDFKRLEGVL